MEQKLVYIGCGHHRLKNFVHAEINLGKNKSGPPDILCDISDYIPLPDNAIDLVYSIATMEHLTYSELLNCFLECRRILKKGGCVRMVVPDLDKMVRDYLNKVYDPNQKSPGKPNENYIDTFVGRIMYFDHRYDHNFDTILRALKKTGFSNARVCRPGDSLIASANSELYTAEKDRVSDLIVEAVKLDEEPVVQRMEKIYPKNIIAKILAKYLNVKIGNFTERKSRFPQKYWLKTYFLFNKNKLNDPNLKLK